MFVVVNKLLGCWVTLVPVHLNNIRKKILTKNLYYDFGVISGFEGRRKGGQNFEERSDEKFWGGWKKDAPGTDGGRLKRTPVVEEIGF